MFPMAFVGVRGCGRSWSVKVWGGTISLRKTALEDHGRTQFTKIIRVSDGFGHEFFENYTVADGSEHGFLLEL